MQTVFLGTSPLEVSRLAYGCWRLAGGWDATRVGPEDRARGRQAIYAAIEAGITFFDHADIYCGGVPEEIFGEVMKASPELRKRVVIASKCGIRLPEGSQPYHYDSRHDYIVRSCEASLRRLQVETIDLYQIHRPDLLTHPEEIAAAFSDLAAQGKVREFGVSNYRPSQVAALQRVCPMDLQVNQIECSLLQTSALFDGTLDQCVLETITPLAWSPLAGGQLGDRASDLLTSQQSYRPDQVIPLLDRLADYYRTSRSNLALAWLLKHPAKIVPIIGSINPERIAASAKAANVEISREHWYELLVAGRGTPLP